MTRNVITISVTTHNVITAVRSEERSNDWGSDTGRLSGDRPPRIAFEWTKAGGGKNQRARYDSCTGESVGHGSRSMPEQAIECAACEVRHEFRVDGSSTSSGEGDAADRGSQSYDVERLDAGVSLRPPGLGRVHP